MYSETTLSGGLAIITHRMPQSASASIGFWIRAGGRFETRENNGISHFLEHLLFKGTQKRTHYQIKEEIEGRGGSLNAFTSEEATCYLARVMSRHLPIAINVLSDMILNPLLEDEHIERERMVILEEIKMYRDFPSAYVHALFDELLWPEQPLGFMIVGREEVITSLKRGEIFDYKNKLYNSANIVVAVSGNINHEEIVSKVESAFSPLPDGQRNHFSSVVEKQSEPEVKVKTKDTEQTHLCLGGRALRRDHPDKYAAMVLNTILGGNMSSRLFNEVREKRGLAYEIHSSISGFYDTGVLVISAGVDNRKVSEAVSIILKEMRRFKEETVSHEELERAKEFITGQIVLGLESTSAYMHWLGENKLLLEKTLTPVEVTEKIKRIKAEDVQRIANRVFELKERLKDKLYQFIDKYKINVIIAENCLSIPLHIPLGLALTEVIAETGIPTIAHHHDFSWERDRFIVNAVNDYIEMAFPPDLPTLRHVVINSVAQKQLAARKGVPSFLIPNVLDFHQNSDEKGDPEKRKHFREDFGFEDNDIIFLQPTRIVARKGIEHAIDLVRRLANPRIKLVVTHSSEDEGLDYYNWIIEDARRNRIPICFIENRLHNNRRGQNKNERIYSLWDIYPHAGFATYPSSFEGFGNAFLEAVFYKKPILVNRYSIFVSDIEPKGFKVISMEGYLTDTTVNEVKKLLDNPDAQRKMVETNFQVAKKFFSYDILKRRLTSIFISFYGMIG
ncbi:MAG: putative zinc protease [Syntrophomonadaceae bacterium]|nr:putative zinc protease [Bacillota bacterium]